MRTRKGRLYHHWPRSPPYGRKRYREFLLIVPNRSNRKVDTMPKMSPTNVTQHSQPRRQEKISATCFSPIFCRIYRKVRAAELQGLAVSLRFSRFDKGKKNKTGYREGWYNECS